MIKGVNKQVLEISETQNGFFEKAIFFVNPEYSVENDNYTYENGMIILKDTSLTYSRLSIENDFSLYVDVKRVKLGTFLTTHNNGFSLSVVRICGVYYCELSVANSDLKQYIELPNAELEDDSLINVSGNDNTLIFEVKRINGYYDLKYKEVE